MMIYTCFRFLAPSLWGLSLTPFRPVTTNWHLYPKYPLHLQWHAMMEVMTTTIMCVVCEQSQTMLEGRGNGWSVVVGGGKCHSTVMSVGVMYTRGDVDGTEG